MRVSRLIGNVRLAASTALTHFNDDPVSLVIQVSRRLPPGAVRRLAGLTGRVTALRWVRMPVVGALSAHLLGNSSTVGAILGRASVGGINVGSARRLADVALAAGMLDEADALLARAGSNAATAGQRARRRWYDGDMTGAIDVLQEAGQDRHAERLAGEVRVFEGWAPALEDTDGYEPAGRTVLHLLTNSLPHTGSGYAQRTHSLLKAQADGGWTVHAATRLGYPVQVGKLLAKDMDVLDGVRYHRLLPVPMARGFDQRLQQQAEEFLRLALDLKPAVLHVTTPFLNGIVVEQVARALGIPWVYEARGQLADTWASNRPAHARASERYKLFTDREAQVMRNASLVVTLGEAMKQKIVRDGVPEERVLLSPNAVGEDYLDEPIESADARRLLGLEEDGIFVGTVSSLVDYEGLDYLLEAVALLAPEHPALRCLIVGDGVALPALRALAQTLGIRDRVVFTGRVPRDQARLHHLALDIFVVPRRDLDVTRSVTPLKPIEAMACSRPVVASDLPALREIVSAFSGVLVKPEDPVMLAAGINGLLEEGRLSHPARSRAREARDRVLEQRTWAVNAAAYSRAYAAVGAV